MKLTNRKEGGHTFRMIWLGEFGHLIFNVVPRINAVRQELDYAYIKVLGYEGDHIYFRDNEGRWTIDEFVPVPFFAASRGCQDCKGELPDFVRKELDKFGEVDRVMNSLLMTTEDYKRYFRTAKRIAYPFKNIIGNEARIGDGNHVVVFSRNKSFGDEKRSWDNARWCQFIYKLAKDNPSTKFYICGTKEQSVHFKYSDNIINMLDVPERSQKTLNLLSNARYCVADCSGSANYAIQVGTPTFVSGPPNYKPSFEDMDKRNYFGAYVLYQSCDLSKLTISERLAGLEEFLKNYRNTIKKEVYTYEE